MKNRRRSLLLFFVFTVLGGFNLSSLLGVLLPIGRVLHEYARQKAALRRTGRIVNDFDLLIGATAIVHGLTLVTWNT